MKRVKQRYNFTLSDAAHDGLRWLAGRATGHNSMSLVVEDLVMREVSRKKKLLRRQRERERERRVG